MGSVKNETTKERLIHTAVAIMAEKGVDLFATKLVAEQAGVSESLIYKYFGTRENLINTCYTTMLSLYCERVMTLTEYWYSGMALNECREMWDAYIDILLEDYDRTTFMFDYVLSPRANKELVKETAYALLDMELNKAIRSSHMDLQDEVYIFRRDAARIIGIGYALSVIRERFKDTTEGRDMLWETVSGCVKK